MQMNLQHSKNKYTVVRTNPVQEQNLVGKWFKDPPEQLAGQVKLFLWRHPKVGPAIREAVIFPTPLVMICQKLLDVKEKLWNVLTE